MDGLLRTWFDRKKKHGARGAVGDGSEVRSTEQIVVQFNVNVVLHGPVRPLSALGRLLVSAGVNPDRANVADVGSEQ